MSHTWITASFVRTHVRRVLVCLLMFFLPGLASAQFSELEIWEVPPYLDPPTNKKIGVADLLIDVPGAPLPGPHIPDLQYLNSAYQLLGRAGYRSPVLSPRIRYVATGETRYAVFRYDFKSHPLKDADDVTDIDADDVTDVYDGSERGIYINIAIDCDAVTVATPMDAYPFWIAVNSGAKAAQPHEYMQTFSHELFHAFQAAYPMFESECVKAVGAPPGWIQEGLADAAANAITEHRMTKAWKSQWAVDYLGLRSYRIAFQDPNDWDEDPYFRSDVAPAWSDYQKNHTKEEKRTEPGKTTEEENQAELVKAAEKKNQAELDKTANTMGYHTSGFWQFLARRSTAVRPDRATNDDMGKYLATWIPLLDEPLPGYLSRANGWFREVNEYIDTYLPLKNKPSNSQVDAKTLYGWLPEFFTEYATWWEGRHSQLASQGETPWLRRAFGNCETVTLKPSRTASGSTGKLTLENFRKNSARCIDVKLSGFTGPVSLKIRAEVESPERADQLHLGLARVEAPAGSGTRVKSCWDYWSESEIWCRLVGKVEKSPVAKTWESEQFTGKSLKLGSDSVDARVTYVISNVAPQPDQTVLIKSLEVTFSATYNFGGSKQFAPAASVRPLDPKSLSAANFNRKETFYKLYTGAPPPGMNLFDITLNEIDQGEQPRCGGDGEHTFCAYDTGGDYFIRPSNRVSFGQTGFIHASVHKTAEDGDALVSTFCKSGADLKAVEILDSGDDGMVLRVNTDLCDIPSPQNDFCDKQPTCPVRDHLMTTITLALGREHFAETAPIHLRTPGTRYDMDLYFRFGVPTETRFPNTSDSAQATTSSNSPSAGAGSGPGSSGGGTAAPCACTCEERESILREAEDLKVRQQAGENINVGDIMGLERCTASCETEYMLCELEKNRRQEAVRDAERQAQPALDCDCSCSGIEALMQRGQALQADVQPGDPAPLEQIKRVSQCMNVCQEELLACAMQ